jgi:hypothetical protein
MECPEVRRLVDEYIDKTLGERQRALLEDHTGSCPDCRRELEKALRYREMMSGLSRVDAPDGFLAGVRNRIAEEKLPEKQGAMRRLREFLFFPLKVKLPIGATAAAAAVLAIVIAVRVTGPERQGGKTTGRLAGTKAEMKKSGPVLEESPAPAPAEKAHAREEDGYVEESAGTGRKEGGPEETAREERIEVRLLLKTRTLVSGTETAPPVPAGAGAPKAAAATGAEGQKRAESAEPAGSALKSTADRRSMSPASAGAQKGGESFEAPESPASAGELVGRIAGFIGQEGGTVLEIIEPEKEGESGTPVTLLAEAQAVNLRRILQGLETFGELEIPDQPDLSNVKETTSILLRITIPR